MPHPILTWLGLAPPRAPDAKATSAYRPGQVPPLSGSFAVYLGGRAAWTPRDYAALSREGFAAFLHALGIVGNAELLDEILDSAVHDGG